MVATSLSKVNVSQDVEKKILTAIELKKELEKYETEIKEALMMAMEQAGVDTIKTDYFTASKITRTTYSAKEIPQEFQKVVLDTSKVAKSVTLYGELPDGVTKTVTSYIRWDTK